MVIMANIVVDTKKGINKIKRTSRKTKKAVKRLSEPSNYEKAKKIIESGMQYKTKLETVNPNTGLQKKVHLADVNIAIEQYKKGRTRYTNKDLEKLRRIFNRSRMRSNVYTTAELKSERVVTKNETRSIPFSSIVKLGYEKPSISNAVRLATMLDEQLSGVQYLEEEEKRSILGIIPHILQKNIPALVGDAIDLLEGNFEIDITKATENDIGGLIGALSGIQELAPISKIARKELHEYFKREEEEFEDIGWEFPDLGEISKENLYSQMTDMYERNLWYSEDVREVRINFYTEILPADRETKRKVMSLYMNSSDNSWAAFKEKLDKYLRG